jgi:ATP-dependent RNA helicase RhlE
VHSFAELGVSERVIATLARRNIHAPFPIQALVTKDALAGRDVLAKSRTGSGKTLGFALPIVERLDADGATPAALVLVPTRELAVQVKDEFSDIAKAKNLRVTAVYGGVGIPEQAKSASRSHIVIATPGRLQDLVQRRLLSLKGVRILVLDEADRMLDMGFQPQVDRIVDRLTEDRQTMFFSATLDGEVGRLAKAYTRDAQLHEVASKTQTVDEAEHRFVPVTSGDKGGALVDLLKKEDVGTSLVFVRTKRGADRLAQRLVKSGIKAVAMHGDLTQSARQRALKGFDEGRYTTLVATDVAARGLDLDDITLVVNYDPPEDHKAYLHRIGRTARAGRKGTGVTLVMPEQQYEVSRIVSRLDLATEFKKEGLQVQPARLAFSSHKGRKSMMRPRPKRKF